MLDFDTLIVAKFRLRYLNSNLSNGLKRHNSFLDQQAQQAQFNFY